MRQLLRVTATFALALVFSAGMAFGQSQQFEEKDIQKGVNEAQIDQADADNSDATIRQESEQKLGRINQSGGDNLGTVIQLGANKSIVELEQTLGSAEANINVDVAKGKFSSVRLYQEGNNFADIDVTRNDEVSGVDGNDFAKQINTGGKGGDVNDLNVTQESGSDLYALQEGEGNDMTVDQDGVGSFEGRQVGDENTIDFTGEHGFTTFGNFVKQFGDLNEARVNQTGKKAKVTATQNGDGNVLKGIGDDTVTQGAGATLRVTQSGGDIARVEQASGNNATIRQTP